MDPSDGKYYTRRQFYDYYGSDETWDNIDPKVFHLKRQDGDDGIWYTKEEFFQHYGTDKVWCHNQPIKKLYRDYLLKTFSLAEDFPKDLRMEFVRRMLDCF